MPLSASLEPIEKTTRATPSGANQRTDPRRTVAVPAGVTLNLETTGLPVLADVRLEWSVGEREEPALVLVRPPPVARVTVNGKLTTSGCRLRDGDALSFRSEHGTHQYTIRIAEAEEKPRKPAAFATAATEVTRRARGRAKCRRSSLSPPPASAVHGTPATAHQHFSAAAAAEEFTCVVCLEIQFLSTTLVPCGHSLCKDCVPASTGACCPVCRTAISHQVPNKMVDNAISALSHCSDFFDREDLAMYFSRSGTTSEDVAAHVSRRGATGKRAASQSPAVQFVRVTNARRGKRCRQTSQQELQGLGTTANDAIEIE